MLINIIKCYGISCTKHSKSQVVFSSCQINIIKHNVIEAQFKALYMMIASMHWLSMEVFVSVDLVHVLRKAVHAVGLEVALAGFRVDQLVQNQEH